MNMVSFSETINSPGVFLLDLGIVLGGLGVVFFRKIIYSALFLGIVFTCVALLYLLLNADFLAAAQILIYVGAINVLIVFAIMLINKPETKINKKKIPGTIAWMTLNKSQQTKLWKRWPLLPQTMSQPHN